MTQTATAYDKFSNFKLMTNINRDKNYSYVIDSDWTTPASKEFWGTTNEYWFKKDEFLPAILSVLDRFQISPETSDSSPTVFSRFVFSKVFTKMEEEIAIRVEMSPKAVRNIILKIDKSSKGIPNPIIL